MSRPIDADLTVAEKEFCRKAKAAIDTAIDRAVAREIANPWRCGTCMAEAPTREELLRRCRCWENVCGPGPTVYTQSSRRYPVLRAALWLLRLVYRHKDRDLALALRWASEWWEPRPREPAAGDRQGGQS